VVSKKCGEVRVHKLGPVVSLDDFNGKIKLGANVRMKVSECGEDIRLMFERKCPEKMSKVVKKNKIIFEPGSASNGRSPNITMKKFRRTRRGRDRRIEWQLHMFAKLTGMTHAMCTLITHYGARAL
jgi:hypothetical protein